MLKNWTINIKLASKLLAIKNAAQKCQKARYIVRNLPTRVIPTTIQDPFRYMGSCKQRVKGCGNSTNDTNGAECSSCGNSSSCGSGSCGNGGEKRKGGACKKKCPQVERCPQPPPKCMTRLEGLKEFLYHPLTWERNNGYFNIMILLALLTFLFCATVSSKEPEPEKGKAKPKKVSYERYSNMD